MVKSTIAAVLACVYVALSVWLVRSEGQSYRNSLTQARPAPAVTANPVPEHTVEADELSKADTAPPRAPDVQPAEEPEKVATVTAPSAAKHAGHKPGGHPAAKAPKAAPEPPQFAMGKPDNATSNAKPGNLGPFWNQPELQRNWKLSNLSDQDEMRLGEELHSVIMGFNPPAPSGPWRERVHAAAKPLLARVSRKEIKYTFTILDSEAVNAFSHLGGHVYLSRGLFAFLGEGEEVALQFVLAHEIAHVDLRHMIQCLQDPGVEAIQHMGTLGKAYFWILPFGYLDRQEYAADLWAYRQLIALDHTRYEALKFLRKLKGYAEVHDFTDGRAKNQLRPGSSPVENHLRAHTATWQRLDELESSINGASPKSK